jgi:hypothetical protein
MHQAKNGHQAENGHQTKNGHQARRQSFYFILKKMDISRVSLE